jgi:hypothetical protein
MLGTTGQGERGLHKSTPRQGVAWMVMNSVLVLEKLLLLLLSLEGTLWSPGVDSSCSGVQPLHYRKLSSFGEQSILQGFAVPWG